MPAVENDPVNSAVPDRFWQRIGLSARFAVRVNLKAIHFYFIDYVYLASNRPSNEQNNRRAALHNPHGPYRFPDLVAAQ